LTVPIQGTDTREKGGHNPSLQTILRFSGNQIIIYHRQASAGGRDEGNITIGKMFLQH